MTDSHLVDAVVRAVLAQIVQEEEPPCACHAAPRGCCPDRMGRMLGQGAARFGLQAGTNLYPRDIARRIDHTLLKPEATREQIEALCREAREHDFATVCLNELGLVVQQPNELSLRGSRGRHPCRLHTRPLERSHRCAIRA